MTKNKKNVLDRSHRGKSYPGKLWLRCKICGCSLANSVAEIEKKIKCLQKLRDRNSKTWRSSINRFEMNIFHLPGLCYVATNKPVIPCLLSPWRKPQSNRLKQGSANNGQRPAADPWINCQRAGRNQGQIGPKVTGTTDMRKTLRVPLNTSILLRQSKPISLTESVQWWLTSCNNFAYAKHYFEFWSAK